MISGRNPSFKCHFSDITSTPGVTRPGDRKRGDSFQCNAGMALALNECASISLSFSHLLSKAGRMRADGQGGEKVIGSEANAATFNAGLTRARSERISMVGIGPSPDVPDFSVGIKLPYSF